MELSETWGILTNTWAGNLCKYEGREECHWISVLNTMFCADILRQMEVGGDRYVVIRRSSVGLAPHEGYRGYGDEVSGW